MPVLPPAPPTWNVLPHGPLEALEDGLWRIVGTLSNMALPRTCVVARHTDADGDGLVIHSAVAVRDDVLEEILAHGTPRWLVVPNGLHRLDAPAWKDRFPDLQVICPPSAQKAVAEKVPVDHTFEEVADRFGPETGVSLRPLAGVDGKEWALIVHHGAAWCSLVVNDAVFNVPHQKGFGGIILRLMGSSGGPRVTAIGKRLLVGNAAALAADLRALADLEGLRRVIPAHGELIDADAPGVLRAVADRLHR